MAPRKGAKQAADGIVIAAADSNVSSPKKKKTTAKTVVAKPKQSNAGTRRAKAADKRENEVADNEATSPAKKSRGRAKKVITVAVKPKSPAKTINSAKNKSKKINNKQKIKPDTEEDNADNEVAQITEKKTRARATTKKAGAAKKPPAKPKTALSTAKRSKKVTTIENGAGDAESVGDEGPSKTTTRRRKAAEKTVAPVATKSKTTRKRKNEDNKNLNNEQIIEKEKHTEPVVKKSRRANKVETGAGDVVKLDQDVKVTKPKEKTKKRTAKKPDAKPETSTEEKIETTEKEEKNSQNATLQEDNVKETFVKKTVTRRKPNTVTVTESKSNKRKINVNKKDETKKQKKEQTTTEENDVMIDYVQEEELSISKTSTLKLDETVAEDNNLSGNDNANNSKEDSVNKDSPETKSNFNEIERSPSFLSL